MHALTIGIVAAVYAVGVVYITTVYYEDAESSHERAFAIVTGVFWPLYLTMLGIAYGIVALARKRARR